VNVIRDVHKSLAFLSFQEHSRLAFCCPLKLGMMVSLTLPNEMCAEVTYVKVTSVIICQGTICHVLLHCYLRDCESRCQDRSCQCGMVPE
jgi:hypothetical protein